MSCNILSDNHYSFIYNQLEDCLRSKEFNTQLTVSHCIGDFLHKDLKVKNTEDLKVFLNTLMQHNVNAYNERYPNDTETMPDNGFNPCIPFIPEPFNPIALIKALRAVDYQCDDSTEYKKSTFCVLLDKLMNTIAMEAITDTKEYDQAKWFI